MTAVPSAEFRVEVAEAVVVRPGDTLVLRTRNDVTMEDVEHLLDQVKDQLPDVKVLVVAIDGEMLAFRPEAPR